MTYDNIFKDFPTLKGMFDTTLWPMTSLESVTSNARQFPAYNIVVEENETRIELAVAGYSRNRLEVEKSGNTLIVQGKADIQKATSKVIKEHKGIKNADFTRTFKLSPNAKVTNVTLLDGILTITLTADNPAPPPKTTFEIK